MNVSKVRLHRHQDNLAILVGEGETKYITPEQAYKLRNALNEFLRDVENNRFSESTFSTKYIGE